MSDKPIFLGNIARPKTPVIKENVNEMFEFNLDDTWLGDGFGWLGDKVGQVGDVVTDVFLEKLKGGNGSTPERSIPETPVYSSQAPVSNEVGQNGADSFISKNKDLLIYGGIGLVAVIGLAIALK